MWLKRPLTWIIFVVVLAMAGLPVAVAERYTSPTQDGQYSVHPVRAYHFIWTLVRLSGGAALGSSGEALTEAKRVWSDSGLQPRKVELLFFPDPRPYAYVTRDRVILELDSPPMLVWEIWGTTSGKAGAPDVVGFLDYVTGGLLDSASLTGVSPAP